MIKKLLVFTLSLVAVVLFISCSSSPESKAEEFADEIIKLKEDGDMLKLAEVMSKAYEYEKSLSKEDKKIYEEAFKKAMEEKTGIDDGVRDALNDAFSDSDSDTNTESLDENTDESIDEDSETSDEDIAKAEKDMEKALKITEQATKTIGAMGSMLKDLKD